MKSTAVYCIVSKLMLYTKTGTEFLCVCLDLGLWYLRILAAHTTLMRCSAGRTGLDSLFLVIFSIQVPFPIDLSTARDTDCHRNAGHISLLFCAYFTSLSIVVCTMWCQFHVSTTLTQNDMNFTTTSGISWHSPKVLGPRCAKNVDIAKH